MKKLLMLLSLVSGIAYAALPMTSQDAYVADHYMGAPAAQIKLGTQLYNNIPHVATAVINYTAIAASTNTVVNMDIPDNAIIINADYEVLTTFESATDAAIIGLGISSASDLVTAVAISTGTPWDAGMHNTSVVPQTATSFIKTSAVSDLIVTRAGNAESLTAGKMRVMLFYVISE